MSRVLKFVLLMLFVELTIGLDKVLIFPTTNPLHKFLAGFGVPVQDLDYETVVMGYVFKTRFKLPASVRQLLTHNTVNIARNSVSGYVQKNSTTFDDDIIDLQQVNTTHSKDYMNEVDEASNDISETEPEGRGSGYRWAIYKGLEAFGDRMGLSGRACVLKSICETAEVPFHYHNGIYAEVLHIILTPSSSVDKLSTHSDNEYFHAEVLGKSGAPCDRVFKECKRSFLDQFSDIYDMSKGIFEQFGK